MNIEELYSIADSLMEEWGYEQGEIDIHKIIDKFLQTHQPILEMFEKHPNHNGNYQIILDYIRTGKVECDKIVAFCEWVMQKRNDCNEFCNLLKNYYEQYATEEFADALNTLCPALKAVAGQKTSRIVFKWTKIVGLDADMDFEKAYAKYADAINPLTRKGKIAISCNPLDLLTIFERNHWYPQPTMYKNVYYYEPRYTDMVMSFLDSENTIIGCFTECTLSWKNGCLTDYLSLEKYIYPKDIISVFRLTENELQPVFSSSGGYTDFMVKEIQRIAGQVIADCKR